ncbi:MAG: DnaB helicase C-terminal domain-containing protein [Endomicrobia bacterium]|nr:DnaB helicase C-terminal domain-containing protein [Endomicrobiia bacterium]
MTNLKAKDFYEYVGKILLKYKVAWGKKNLHTIAKFDGLDKYVKSLVSGNIYVSERGQDFALRLIHHIVFKENTPVLLFSKIPSAKFITKLISLQTKISSDTLIKGNIFGNDWSNILSAAHKIVDTPLYINSTITNIPQLCEFTKKLKTDNNALSLVVIERDIKIVKALNTLANTSNIAIVIVKRG